MAFRTSGGEALNGKRHFKQRKSNLEVDKHQHASAPFCVPLIHDRE
jgi:hypothetical protein